MVLNSRFSFLKTFLWNEEKKEQGKEVKKKVNKDEKQILKIKKEKGRLEIPKTFKSEFHFLKFPFFDLCPRASKKDRIEIKEIEKGEEGEIEVWWKVSRNIDSDFPSSFARRIHKEVIEKILNNMGRPVSELIKLGSLRQICKAMNIVPSGKSFEEIKRALKNIKKATIEAKGTFRQKEKNGARKFFEGDFNLYDGLFFTGEILPDGTEADAVYVLLNDMYIQNFNNNFVVPMDYQYFKSIKGGIASRMYEVLSVWFYPALEHGKKYIEKEYSEICDYFPLIRQNAKNKAKKQLKLAHQQHRESGFLACEPEWVDIGKKDDWLIRYYIGSRAKDWYKQNKRLNYNRQETKLLEEPLIREEEEERKREDNGEQVLVKEFLELGITKKVAERLVEKESKELLKDWIEAVHETKAENKAAFLVKAIQEKWEVPEPFKKRKEKLVREKGEKRKEELKEKYNKYLIAELDEYIKKTDKQILEKELEEYEDVFYEKYPFYEQFKGSDKMEPYIEREYKKEKGKKIGLLSFEEWEKGKKVIT